MKTDSTTQANSIRSSPRFFIWVAATLVLALSLTGQLSAAPETMLTTVDDGDGNILGLYSSLALNSSGYPVISYYDDTTLDLKLAVCDDAACSNPTITVVDGDDDLVGTYTSLALNSGDHAVISYYDIDNRALKLAVCNDAACSNPAITTVDGGDDWVGAHSSLALNSSGYPVISYEDDSNGNLKLAMCNDAICSNPTLTTVHASDDILGQYTSLALNSSDHPVISYFDSTNRELRLVICKNVTCATTIQPPTFPTFVIVDGGDDAVGWDNSLALNSSGHPVISYRDETNDNLKLAVCNDASCSNPNLITVDGGDDNVGRSNSLALDSSDQAVISYQDETNGDLKLAVCNDAACSNPTLTTVDGGDDWVGAYNSLALNSSDQAVISYFDSTNDDLKLALCPICTAPARTTVDSNDDVGRQTSLALNSSGYPVISYRDETNGDLKLAVCNNLDCSNLTVATLDSSGNVGSWTSLALNDSGHAVISYRDITNGNLKLAVCDNVACIEPTLTTVDDSEDNLASFTSLALDSSGHAVMSYRDITNGNLKLAVCNDANCTNPTITVVDSTNDVGLDTSVVLNDSGYSIVSYYDKTNGDLKLAVCNDAACSNPTLTTVDNGDNVGRHTSLALNSNELPVISYRDISNQALKLALCNVETCTNPTLTTVDDSANVAQFTSLAISDSNLPLISYYDTTTNDLKLAVCGDPACTEATFVMVDAVGNVGQHTSLALGGHGFPAMSYYDVTNKDLRLASYARETIDPPRDEVVYLPMIIK